MTDTGDGRGLTRRELLEGIAGTAVLSAMGGRTDSAATAPLSATAPSTPAAEWDDIVMGASALTAATSTTAFLTSKRRGFKIAHDTHGSRFDPDTGDRQPTAAGLADVRAYLRRRFPALAARPLVESRVCQYENSSNGDLLIDVHPRWPNALLVGAGSGHGFKHGPAVGRYAAALLGGASDNVEPRFSLASKGGSQRREVH